MGLWSQADDFDGYWSLSRKQENSTSSEMVECITFNFHMWNFCRSLERKAASKGESRESAGAVKEEREQTMPRRRSASVPRLRPEPGTCV